MSNAGTPINSSVVALNAVPTGSLATASRQASHASASAGADPVIAVAAAASQRIRDEGFPGMILTSVAQ
jgi:hypothetical protein